MVSMQRFKQYKALRVEIKSLERRINKLPKGHVTDYGVDYKTGYPRTIILEGEADPSPKNRLRSILENRKKQAEELLLEIETEISKIPDADTRFVLSEYYCEGKSFKEIAFDLGYRDEKTVRNLKDKYFNTFKKNPKNPK